MRVFDDNDGTMWKAGVKDIGGEVLSVSQFTLMANTTKGNKPDFHGAMGSSSSNSSASSREMYSTFLNRLGELYEPSKIKELIPKALVLDGQFGAMMSVSLANEGPVTLQIDSRKFEYVPVDDSKPSKKAKSGTSTPATPGESVQGTA
ncbi:D-tyrosyl-tRNA(Tyr) deacylase [Tulasnella sp. 425]|nr:D-tyrosyl-tRNA(Tyr) deacylase [Tulasnella sp. 425]